MPRPWFFLLLLLLPRPSPGDVYHWTDSSGINAFGDSPPSSGHVERLTLRTFITVKRVIDGDTLELFDGRRVRLIGINAPEVAHRDKAGEPGGKAATDFLRARIEGKPVRLVFERERKDKYHRLLAHVIAADGTNVNALLLEQGFAHATVHPPNTARTTEYFRLERVAREAGRGIWQLARYRVHPAREAVTMASGFERLEGEVKSIRSGRKYVYLTLAGGLSAYVAKTDTAAFAAAGTSLYELRRRTIIVRGWVHKRRGKARVRLVHPSQVEMVR